LQLLAYDEAKISIRQRNMRRKFNGVRCRQPQGTLLKQSCVTDKLTELLWIGFT